MEKVSNKKISTILSLLFTFFTGLLLFLLFKDDFILNYKIVIFALLADFLIMYIVLYYVLNHFVIHNIKPLFEIIDTLKMPPEKLYESIEEGKLLTKLDQEILEWSKGKLEEIATLKANEKYRKEFFGDVSHELKTPLFNIQGYILTLIDSKLQDESINMQYLKRTSKNINRLMSIVKDLERISKLETGEHLLEMKKFNIVKMVNEVFEMQEIRAKSKQITFKFDKKYDEPIYVLADKKAIANVLNNLIINSVIYGKDEGSTEVSIRQSSQTVFVSVKDDGIGIEDKHQKRIFERFFRVDKSRSKIQGGTGLGLSIVKHSIEAHKQSISVESKLNEGTQFTFTLDKAEM